MGNCGRGLCRAQGSGEARGIPAREPGDLYAVLDIALPKPDTVAAKAAYEAFKKALDFNPRAGLGV